MQLDNNTKFKTSWEGIVRVDDTFDDYVTNIQEIRTAKELTVKDMKYQHSIGAKIEGVANWSELNLPISILIEGKEVQNFMKCVAGITYVQIEKTRGIFKKETYFENKQVGYGFKLEPISTSIKEAPCLATYRARIGRDHSFSIHEKGIVAFFSGSQSAIYSDTAANFSITSVFIASDEKPFKATVRKKDAPFSMICTNSGIKETSQDKGENIEKSKPKSKEDPLAVLKLRLAKGEITKEEYEDLKKMLE